MYRPVDESLVGKLESWKSKKVDSPKRWILDFQSEILFQFFLKFVIIHQMIDATVMCFAQLSNVLYYQYG